MPGIACRRHPSIGALICISIEYKLNAASFPTDLHHML